MEKFSVICPCCEAALTIDAQTGAILAHEEKKKIHGSFEDQKGELSKQKELRDQLFSQEMSSMKDRERLLDEKSDLECELSSTANQLAKLTFQYQQFGENVDDLEIRLQSEIELTAQLR